MSSLFVRKLSSFGGVRRGILWMTLSGVSFATMSALAKWACQRVPTFEVVFFRGLVGFAIVAGVEWARTGRLRPGIDRQRLFWRSVCGFTALAAYVWAIAHIDLAIANALNQSSPVFVALLAWLVLRERLPWRIPALVVLACAGAWLVVAPDLTRIDAHALIGLSSALLSALAYTLVRAMRETEPSWVIVRWFTGLSVLLGFPFLFIDGFVWPQAAEWVALLGVGLFGLLGQLAMTEAYHLEQATVVSPFLYAGVPTSLMYGWLFWDEWPRATALIGLLVITGASLTIGWVSGRRPAPLALEGKHER